MRGWRWLPLLVAAAQPVWAQPMPGQPGDRVQGPATRENCEAYNKQWEGFFKRIGDQHQRCLDANRGGENNPQGDCSYAACQPYHNPGKRFPQARLVYDQCMVEAREAEKRAAQIEAERRQREREQEKVLREAQNLAALNHANSQAEADAMAKLYEQQRKTRADAESKARAGDDGKASSDWLGKVGAQFDELKKIKQTYETGKQYVTDPLGTLAVQVNGDFAAATNPLAPGNIHGSRENRADVDPLIQGSKKANDKANQHELSHAATEASLDALGTQASNALDSFDRAMASTDSTGAAGSSTSSSYAALNQAMGFGPSKSDTVRPDTRAGGRDGVPSTGVVPTNEPDDPSLESTEDAGQGDVSEPAESSQGAQSLNRLDQWAQHHAGNGTVAGATTSSSPSRSATAGTSAAAGAEAPDEGACRSALAAQQRQIDAANARPLPEGVVPSLRRLMWASRQTLDALNRHCPETPPFQQTRREMQQTFEQASHVCSQLSSSGGCTPESY